MTDESVFAKLPDYIQSGLNTVASEQGFTEGLVRFEFEDGSKKGDGFMGDLFKVIIREQNRDDVVVVCKTLPQSEARKMYTIRLFHREVEAYNEVLPMMRKFQIEMGISEGDPKGFWSFPKSYYAYCDVQKLEGVIIMEDLREKQFRMWKKSEPVDYEHTRMLVEQLGKLHAISFALKDQKPELFERFKQFKDPLGLLIQYEPRQAMAKMMNGSCERAISTLDENDELSRTKMQPIRGVVTELYRNDTDGSQAEPYAVLGHGDCWVNNTMFRYQDENVKPTDICMLDWQLCRYVSPALDFVYFIFICTDEVLRANHYDQLLQDYYKSLSDCLLLLGGDPERQFPQSAFEDQLKRFGRFALLISFLVLPVICTPSEELPDIDQHMEKAQKAHQSGDDSTVEEIEFSSTANADAIYRKRARGMIRDLVKFGYL
ncbi:uncharacterized protein LOC131684378 [Topomyia yanbarensis]|uniref:uncharacterized protein LOC131684378 n=1 Tax=Topomyia yanbarensis TaxID=2498891 RepID=UPI00273B8BDA|nr:uncharacterized protein LOC131684378 [Topomyia yanbarensis]